MRLDPVRVLSVYTSGVVTHSHSLQSVVSLLLGGLLIRPHGVVVVVVSEWQQAHTLLSASVT